jgi:hypothetical protein
LNADRAPQLKAAGGLHPSSARIQNMKHRRLSLVILFLVLVMSGCSYRYDFVVINKSERPIEVQYKLKRHTWERYADITTPAKVTLAEFEKAEYQWQNLAKDQYQFDDLTGTFKVTVAPDEVLLLDFAMNYRGDENQFDLVSIKIDGASGSISLEGRQAQTQFRTEGDTKYILRYR